MPNLAQTLKQEIARISRKEVREDVTALRKAASTYRSEIAALKRSVKELQVQMRATQKASASGAPVQAQEGASSPPGRKPTFSAERLKKKRQALGLSQAQMASLLGISTLSQWKWESGQVAPRASKLPRYFAVMAMGKREATKQLEAS